MSAIESNIDARSGRGVVTREDMITLDGGSIPSSSLASSSSLVVPSSPPSSSSSSGLAPSPPPGPTVRSVLRSGAVDVLPGGQYEYLDHTADVQLHAWGGSLTESLGWLAVAMFGYMTDLATVDVDREVSEGRVGTLAVAGHDLDTLIFAFLDEWLYQFHDTGFVAKRVEVMDFVSGDAARDAVLIDREGKDELSWSLKTRGFGEIFTFGKHPQGTEVKAITYSNMQVVKGDDGKVDIFVIIDI